LITETLHSGFAFADDAPSLAAAEHDPHVTKLLALLHPDTMNTAFDRLGLQAGYSDELRAPAKEGLRRQPGLPVMTAAALTILNRTSPAGFFLVVEGASIDKKCHDQDADRAIWEVIEMDNAVAQALAFAKQTNDNANPDDDTLVIVTADHETGGLALAGVGNERYQPALLGKAVRDYAANLRFNAQQTLALFPNYEPGPEGFPRDPDPSRKLILGFGAGTDRFENFTSNRLARPATKVDDSKKAVANPERDGPGPEAQGGNNRNGGGSDKQGSAACDNRNVGGRTIPGFLVTGLIENGADQDPGAPGDTSSVATSAAGHTAADVPLSASGAGAALFVGTFDNTDAFFKMAMALASWKGPSGGSGVGQARPASASSLPREK
jgi:alkaline phosphatase